MSASTTGLRYSLIRLRALLVKEFLQLFRDPRMRFFLIGPPLIQLVVFGYAATLDVRDADIAIVDQARSLETRDAAAAITSTGHFHAHYYADMASAAAAMDRSKVRAIVRFAPDFPQRRAAQVIADGSDSNSALLILGQVNEILRRNATAETGFVPPVQVEERAWFNPNLEDRWYFVPGIIANVVLIATMILSAMTVVREREFGTLEQLMVTPLARLEFVLGKITPVAAVGLIDVGLVSVIAVAWFEVPFRGDPLGLLLGSVLFLTSSLGLGLLVSSYSSTQQQAMLLAFFITMPAITLSGFAFPISNMPEWVQWLTWLDPLRYYLVVVRDLFLKGGGVTDHLFEYGMMALLGVVAQGLSMLRLR
jgi:drug efflux transport system permease protein